MKKYNMSAILTRAWEIRRERNATMSTAMKLAWGEAKGVKLYTTHAVEQERAAITAYILKLGKLLKAGEGDEHDVHKYDILRAALLVKVDANGITVHDGKTIGLIKYAIRNAA